MKHLALLFTAVFMLVGTNAEAKILTDSLTNHNFLAFPTLEDRYIMVDTMPTTIITTEREAVSEKTVVVNDASGEDITEEEVAKEDVAEEEVSDDAAMVEVVKNDIWRLPMQHTTTILFDTERDAAGNAMRRHIYYYDGRENSLYDDSRSVIGVSKIKRMSFPAGEEGVEPWRQALLRLAASKNQKVIAEITALRERWEKGEIDDSTSHTTILHIKYDNNPCIIALKPMGEAESGDVIDACSVMLSCYISRWIPQEVSHADSVMVFNALFPEKEMPAGVNYYSYGETSKAALINADDIVLPSTIADKLEFAHDEMRLSPVVIVEIKESKSNADGALVALTIDDALVTELLTSEGENEEVEEAVSEYATEEADINILENETYKELVRMHGNDVTEPIWMEVCPLDNHQENRFTATISDVSKVCSSNSALRLFLRDNILLYTDRHTPYRAMKCVIDNFRNEHLYKLTLAY